MKCSDARHLIHLSVGDDTLTDEEVAVAEHLHTCSECRAYNAGMVDAMHTLHQYRDSTTVAQDGSVWAAVERRIHEGRSVLASGFQQPQRQFNGGVVALCACSLVLAFVTIVQSLPVNDSIVSTPPANYQMDFVGNGGAPGGIVPVGTAYGYGRPVGWQNPQQMGVPQQMVTPVAVPIMPVQSRTRNF